MPKMFNLSHATVLFCHLAIVAPPPPALNALIIPCHCPFMSLSYCRLTVPKMFDLSGAPLYHLAIAGHQCLKCSIYLMPLSLSFKLLSYCRPPVPKKL